MPSKEKPRRCAALRDFSFSALHFHSTRRQPISSKAWRSMRKIDSVFTLDRWPAGEYHMFPTSTQREAGSMLRKDTTPIGLPSCSTARNTWSVAAAAFST